MADADLLGEVLEVHGGPARWAKVRVISAQFSSGGLAFAAHFQPFALRGLGLRVEPHVRRVELAGFGGGDRRGVWTPNRVELWAEGGRLLRARETPRERFASPLRRLHWDALDLLYFAGYALWNYLSFPFLLTEPGVAVTARRDGLARAGSRLVVRFPDALPTHSAQQEFHLERSGRLLRHDYTADVIGRWATAANLCLAAERVDGLLFYTRRCVLPRRAGHGVVRGWPTLVWITLDELAVEQRSPGGHEGATTE